MFACLVLVLLLLLILLWPVGRRWWVDMLRRTTFFDSTTCSAFLGFCGWVVVGIWIDIGIQILRWIGRIVIMLIGMLRVLIVLLRLIVFFVSLVQWRHKFLIGWVLLVMRLLVLRRVLMSPTMLNALILSAMR